MLENRTFAFAENISGHLFGGIKRKCYGVDVFSFIVDGQARQIEIIKQQSKVNQHIYTFSFSSLIVNSICAPHKSCIGRVSNEMSFRDRKFGRRLYGTGVCMCESRIGNATAHRVTIITRCSLGYFVRD